MPEAKTKDQAEPEKKAPATKKFVVQKCNIFVESGKKSKIGDVVELTAAQAKQFNKVGALAPFIEDDDEEGDD
mgnify:CR=1 FL=1